MVELFFILLFLAIVVLPLLVMGSILIGGITLGINQVLNVKAFPAFLMALGIIYLFVR